MTLEIETLYHEGMMLMFLSWNSVTNIPKHWYSLKKYANCEPFIGSILLPLKLNMQSMQPYLGTRMNSDI